MRPTLLDAFCGAGGCSVGYHRAGFDVVGVDINPQPSYPFRFYRGDAIEFISRYGVDFSMIHASPPCQTYSVTRSLSSRVHPALVEETREVLIASRRKYVIENVPGAPLRNPIMLCGTMFGLRVIRHRLFECSPALWFAPMSCNHNGRASSNLNNRVPKTLENYRFLTVVGHDYKTSDGRIAMGIDWMRRDELSQAIPPAYTEWIGKQMMKWL